MSLLLISPNLMFVPLDPDELNRIRTDVELLEVYVDSLATVLDLLCRYVGEHGRPQFADPAEVEKVLDEVVERGQHAVTMNPSNLSIAEGMQENIARAKMLSGFMVGRSIYTPDQIKEMISRFLDSVVEQSIQINRR